MFTYMSWIVVGYGLAALLVHLLHRRFLRRTQKDVLETHYILVTRNHELQLEWYIRALSWYARIRGECIRVTVLDQASEDDTLAILRRLYHESGIRLNVIDMADTTDKVFNKNPESADRENRVHVDLRVPQEAAKIPYVHSRI
ncbi:hypothetical protein J41TS12_00760 [Paenibacillus antibioticophila]|uniref:Glycosyl transferase family 2 n=1 Tax=Paenibacillus antibioticophila TaxID=1274374 RepID=A0A920CD53_9BACL|nr:hypothetical protein [Paenibacillus antibioticophila]GIO35215.1 hypothetical protein J41TS12_00760 [Paenibacillus antibioticophila]